MAPRATLETTEAGRCAVRFERRLAHPRATVWQAITELAQLREWFADVLDYDKLQFRAVPGAPLAFVPKPQYAEIGTSSGEITGIEELRLLEYTWDTETLRWELDPDGESGCHLVFTDIFDDRDFASAMAAGWHTGLQRLEDFLDGRVADETAPEHDEAAWQQLRNTYTEAFG